MTRDPSPSVPIDCPTLSFERSGAPPREYPLVERSTVIGRDPHLVLCVNDLKVSRCHAVFTRSGARTYVQDLGSRNGVQVNDRTIKPHTAVRLHSGDRIRVGTTVLIYRAPLVSDALWVAEEVA